MASHLKETAGVPGAQTDCLGGMSESLPKADI